MADTSASSSSASQPSILQREPVPFLDKLMEGNSVSLFISHRRKLKDGKWDASEVEQKLLAYKETVLAMERIIDEHIVKFHPTRDFTAWPELGLQAKFLEWETELKRCHLRNWPEITQLEETSFREWVKKIKAALRDPLSDEQDRANQLAALNHSWFYLSRLCPELNEKVINALTEVESQALDRVAVNPESDEALELIGILVRRHFGKEFLVRDRLRKDQHRERSSKDVIWRKHLGTLEYDHIEEWAEFATMSVSAEEQDRKFGTMLMLRNDDSKFVIMEPTGPFLDLLREYGLQDWPTGTGIDTRSAEILVDIADKLIYSTDTDLPLQWEYIMSARRISKVFWELQGLLELTCQDNVEAFRGTMDLEPRQDDLPPKYSDPLHHDEVFPAYL
ncbi:hypothetical protein BJ508DRAFT_313058 [Ascobolus immersus RN42]|uniref:Uncharacterized protein n=1 Tax=Ascobolus immersus RN42 TaxID=1160509 RepID=A0A3N4HK35_ASCIM|nr:hypothetical protein BJ508DRAFT_313058 [Ascobolus immersus RN42]